MIVVPGVIAPALNANMLVAALITKPTSERAVVEGAPASASVGEGHDLLPLLFRHTLITFGLLGELYRGTAL